MSMNRDLRSATYEEIAVFVFDHGPADEVDDKWYWRDDEDVLIEPVQAIRFLTRLCGSPRELLPRFTTRQIAEGLGYLFGAAGGDEFVRRLWSAEVPWPARRACILAIPNLYAELFEREEGDTEECAFMLWDMIAYDYYCDNRDPANDAEDARVQDAMFEALVRMLRSDNPGTQCAAIHGLGHLCHRDGNRVLRTLLSSTRDLEPDVRAYGASVLEGHFQ